MSNIENVVAMEANAREAINSTIKVICDKYAKSEEDRDEITRAVLGVSYMAEGIGHLKAIHEEIRSSRSQ